METLKKFKNIVLGVAGFLIAIAAIAASPLLPATQGALEAHAAEEKETSDAREDRQRYSRLQLERRVTLTEMFLMKDDKASVRYKELEADLLRINGEIAELEKKLKIS